MHEPIEGIEPNRKTGSQIPVLAGREFLGPEAFKAEGQNYFLLPFRFQRITPEKEVLVNEVGDFLMVEAGTARRIVRREIHPDSPLFQNLMSSFFISETPIPDLLEVLSTRYRTKKAFLNQFTSLHIFVPTLRCDHSCQYCQVSRGERDQFRFDMSLADIDKSVDLMLMSPSEDLTAEFQGGEPLLVFDLVKHAIERIEALKAPERRTTFVLCTSLTGLSPEILHYCDTHRILISTSYDGPAFLHNKNRPKRGCDSHAEALSGIRRCREILGNERVSALMTTSNTTLSYPRELVDDYLVQGFRSIFIRPLNPFGYAKKLSGNKQYTVDQFLAFYKSVLSYIIELNLRGIHFVEDYARIILSHILTPFSSGFTDLQSPNGAVTSVVVYNYDGYVYASDESRMMAEEGNTFFRLGHVQENSYEDIFYGQKAGMILECSVNESLPGCSECAFQPYCGADPVRNYAIKKDMVGQRYSSEFCKRNKEIIRYLFELMDGSADVQKVFLSWVNN